MSVVRTTNLVSCVQGDSKYGMVATSIDAYEKKFHGTDICCHLFHVMMSHQYTRSKYIMKLGEFLASFGCDEIVLEEHNN